VNSPHQKAQAAPYRPRRAALNWVDYLVIAATVLTFATVVFAANKPHPARAETRATIIPAAELPIQVSAPGERPGLIKARIGLALAGR